MVSDRMDSLDSLADRVDAGFARIHQETADLRTEMREGVRDMRTELKSDNARLRGDLKSDRQMLVLNICIWMIYGLAGVIWGLVLGQMIRVAG